MMTADEIEMLIDLLDSDTIPDEYKRLIENMIDREKLKYETERIKHYENR